MKKNNEINIFLERPFLVTGKALIDVKKWKLIIRVQESHSKSKFSENTHNFRENKEVNPILASSRKREIKLRIRKRERWEKRRQKKTLSKEVLLLRLL